MMISQVSFGRTPATIQCRKETKEGLKKAETLLRKSQNKYGRPNSATYIQMKVNAHKDNPQYKEISTKLLANAEEYSEAIMYKPYSSVARVTKGREAQKPLYGDCGECAQAIQNEYLFQHNQPTVNVVMNIRKSNGGFSNHAFNLSNIKKGINPKDPKTWGKEAIVTDLWAGIAMKSSDAIKYYQEIFGANPQTDKITFQLMPDSDYSLQQACLKHFDLLPKPFNPFDIDYKSLYE